MGINKQIAVGEVTRYDANAFKEGFEEAIRTDLKKWCNTFEDIIRRRIAASKGLRGLFVKPKDLSFVNHQIIRKYPRMANRYCSMYPYAIIETNYNGVMYKVNITPQYYFQKVDRKTCALECEYYRLEIFCTDPKHHTTRVEFQIGSLFNSTAYTIAKICRLVERYFKNPDKTLSKLIGEDQRDILNDHLLRSTDQLRYDKELDSIIFSINSLEPSRRPQNIGPKVYFDYRIKLEEIDEIIVSESDISIHFKGMMKLLSYLSHFKRDIDKFLQDLPDGLKERITYLKSKDKS